jgi:chromosome partitioning protein
MPRTIAVANQKGGVGKTTTTLNLGAALHKEGKRVLLVDLDPQAALSTSLESGANGSEKTVYEVLLGKSAASRVVRRTRAGPQLIPANIDLAAAEVELVAEMGRERILSEALEPVRDRYDFILIDCPPSLGLLTINSLVASRDVIVPLQCEYLAMRGLGLLLKTVEGVRARLKRDLEVAGILMTMYNGRTLHAQEVLEEVRKSFGSKVFPMVIKTSVRLKEAPAAGMSILDYAPSHEAARAYRALARELLK